MLGFPGTAVLLTVQPTDALPTGDALPAGLELLLGVGLALTVGDALLTGARGITPEVPSVQLIVISVAV